MTDGAVSDLAAAAYSAATTTTTAAAAAAARPGAAGSRGGGTPGLSSSPLRDTPTSTRPGADGPRGQQQTQGDATRPYDMEGKYCIVTGSNSGIGLQVARGLMRRGGHVVMACRNMAACEEAAGRLRAERLPGSCVCRHIDLEDFTSVRQFVRQQAEELAGPPAAGAGGGAGSAPAAPATRAGGHCRQVDVLVNNAGLMGAPPALDGSDRHLTANHLGPYLLTRLMLPLMGTRGGSRVVNVASRAHFGGGLELGCGPGGDEVVRNNVHHWWWQYARSKLCNVLFTAELQRRFGFQRLPATGAGTGPAAPDTGPGSSGGGGGGGWVPGGGSAGRPVIGAYAVSPGMVDTGIFRHLIPWWAPPWLRAPLRRLIRTPEQGAEVVLYAACSPELQGRDVLFLHDCREMRPSAAARNPSLAADLWRVSAVLVGLPPGDE